jgi:lon-related putative ATP-dependent protease
MCTAQPIPPEVLRRRSDPAEIPFETTAEVAEAAESVGQERALEAMRFGIAIRRSGYNLFALGPPGTGKQTLLRQYLDREAAGQPPPADRCYVHNFTDRFRPRALTLPPGTGVRLQKDMARFVAELRAAMPETFEGEEYRTRKQQLTQRFKDRQEAAFSEVQERAKQRDVAVVRTETGVLLAPLRGGEVLEADRFHELPEGERERLQAALERTREELSKVFRDAHELEREHREEQLALDREFAERVVRRHVDELRARYRELPQVVRYLDEVENDVVENADDFLQPSEEGLEATLRRAFRRAQPDGPSFRRYAVNVFVDNGGRSGAPVVYEDNPTYANLMGRVEHVAEFGALIADFTLAKAGALQRASGGYLILDAIKVLQQPHAWDALKRAIRGGEVRIESIGQLLGISTSVSLEPEPVPLDGCKVVLFGDRTLYYLLSALDPDFLELFKVIVDFEDSMDRGDGNQAVYARLVATIVRKEGLRPFDRGAVARVLEHAARLAGDAGKLSIRMRPVVDLLRESDFWAGRAGRAVATVADVEQAVAEQVRRASRLRERLLEEIRRETILIDTRGESVGQVNGLSVVRLGEYDFGYPTRISARVRVGRGEVVDIEREVELSGPIHSKGVLILAGFLGARFARNAPLSLSASLVFEQSYGAVEGDSASLAELCALLSALAEVPIRQSVALTGSVNQHGQVQAIGGVNEKIEGFFDVCRDRGLTGEQAVLIPRSNVKHLMLRPDVVAAAGEGRFRIVAVETVDEAMELLTGCAAGELNQLVEAKLAGFAETARAFLGTPGGPGPAASRS